MELDWASRLMHNVGDCQTLRLDLRGKTQERERDSGLVDHKKLTSEQYTREIAHTKERIQYYKQKQRRID